MRISRTDGPSRAGQEGLGAQEVGQQDEGAKIGGPLVDAPVVEGDAQAHRVGLRALVTDLPRATRVHNPQIGRAHV